VRKPIDPRKHGLKQPLPSIKAYKAYELGKHPSVEETIHRWMELENACKQAGQRITEGPVLANGGWDAISIKWTIEYDNANYKQEKEHYDTEIRRYEEECRKFHQYEAAKKLGEAENLDDQISRLEKRLANLKAARAGELLPYPQQDTQR